MCTQVHVVLPDGSDDAAVSALVERHKVGRGLDHPGRAAPVLVARERAYLVVPRGMCHCGGASGISFRWCELRWRCERRPWLGVFVTEQGAEHDGTRIVLTVDEMSAFGDDDEEEALYLVEPPPRPPVVRRHGPRRRPR